MIVIIVVFPLPYVRDQPTYVKRIIHIDHIDR